MSIELLMRRRAIIGALENIPLTVLVVDSTGADYSTAQIQSEVNDTTLGKSWSKPYKYLQNAINAAKIGQEIWVRHGLYNPTHCAKTRTTPSVLDGSIVNGTDKTHSRVASFKLKSGVSIYGGFYGDETNRYDRHGGKSILCGDVLRNGNESTYANNVVYSASVQNGILDKFDICNGNANITSGDYYINIVSNAGGGHNGKGKLYNCNLYNNKAVYGSASFGYAGNISTLTDCNIYSNRTLVNGSGIVASANVNNCKLYNNSSDIGNGVSGVEQCTCSNTIIFNNGFSSSTFNNASNMFNCSIFNNLHRSIFLYYINTSRKLALSNSLFVNNKTINFSTNIVTDINNIGQAITTGKAYIQNLVSNVAGYGFTQIPGTIEANKPNPIQMSIADMGITLPSFVGLPTIDGTNRTEVDPTKKSELDNYVANMTTHLTPKIGSKLALPDNMGDGGGYADTVEVGGVMLSFTVPYEDAKGKLRNKSKSTVGAYCSEEEN